MSLPFSEADAIALGEKFQAAINEAEKRSIPAQLAITMIIASMCDWCTWPDKAAFLSTVYDGISISKRWGKK